jgi:ABC-type antimicrobial peptide transport system permease subunit
VLAYLVAQRDREIGIRIALGSSAGGIFKMILREGLMLIGGGLVLGLMGVYGLRRALESQVFGVGATDPVVIGIVAGTLGVVALLACAIPACRATRVDPATILIE